MLAAADNFLFLIFIAIAIFFQLLTRFATKSGRRSGDDSSRRSPPAPRPQIEPDESDEERIRKFLEALGQPASSKPPSPVTPRPSYPKPIAVPRVEPRPIARRNLSPLPPLTTRPPELPPEVGPASQPTPTRQRRVFTPQSEAPTFEVHEGPASLAPITQSEATAAFQPTAPQSVSQPEAKINVVTMLRSTSGLRDAIILREIFGPPRSLQPLDLVGNV